LAVKSAKYLYTFYYNFFRRANMIPMQPTEIESPYIQTSRWRFAGSFLLMLVIRGFLKVGRVKGAISGAVSFLPEHDAKL
jgi:hypothetical protein